MIVNFPIDLDFGSVENLVWCHYSKKYKMVQENYGIITYQSRLNLQENNVQQL